LAEVVSHLTGESRSAEAVKSAWHRAVRRIREKLGKCGEGG
jgi:hypothetical protein